MRSLEASRETLSKNTEKASSWDFSPTNKVQITNLRTVLTVSATFTHRLLRSIVGDKKQGNFLTAMLGSSPT